MIAEVGQIWQLVNNSDRDYTPAQQNTISIGEKVIIRELSVRGNANILLVTTCSGAHFECWGPRFIMDFQLIEP